jgi:Mce-associated membrane protein
VRDGDDTSGPPTVKRNRFTADLVRTGGTWKLESLQQVAVNLS